MHSPAFLWAKQRDVHARAPILLLRMGELTKAADVLAEPGEVLASGAASQLPSSFLAQQTQLPIACSPSSLSWLLPMVREGVVARAGIWHRTLQTVKIPGPHSFKCCHLKAIPSKSLSPLLHRPVACQCPGWSDLVVRGKPILAHLDVNLLKLKCAG